MELKIFSASWCGPCKGLKPIMEELKNEYQNVTFKTIDVDDESELAINYAIRSVPTVVFEKSGIEVSRQVGIKSKQNYIDLINSFL
jgi:thioredoxin 1